MKRILCFTALMVGTCSVAHADDFTREFGIIGLYLNPVATLDFLATVDTVVWSSDIDYLYALDINGFTFTSTDTDDQSDPIPF